MLTRYSTRDVVNILTAEITALKNYNGTEYDIDDVAAAVNVLTQRVDELYNVMLEEQKQRNKNNL